MMKKFLGVFLGLSLLATFVWTTFFLYQKSEEDPVVHEVATPLMADIFVKTVATGNIKPRKEVDVKSKVSGVIEEVLVEAGDAVTKGDVIARIELVPDVEYLRSAESDVEKARLNYLNVERDFERQKKLHNALLISDFEFNKYKLQFDLAEETLQAAEDNVALIKVGVSKHGGKISNIVYATVSGLLLSVPVKEGTFVIESNTFNAGTTIAQIANMNDMIFEGKIDESEVGKLKIGMPISLSIGALGQHTFGADLEYIAPKGYDHHGTIKFDIRAAIKLQAGVFLRAGYSANADIVLNERIDVLAINEGNLIIENGANFVEVAINDKDFERREVVTGLSDGINIEVLSGIQLSEKLKKLY